MKPLRLDDYEDLAREHLTDDVFDFYAGGACDERTLRDNREAFERVRLIGRVLRDVSRRSLATSVLGSEISMPVMVAPVAFQRLAFDDGELATAKAAAKARTLMILAALSSVPIEAVAAATRGPLWFQLYVCKDRGSTLDLVRRAEVAGCRALVVTVDAQVGGKHERDLRHRFQLPRGVTLANFENAGHGELPGEGSGAARAAAHRNIAGSALAAHLDSLFDAALDWNDLAWLIGQTHLPVVLKGVLHPDDARLAVAHGAAGIFVSNHGGRQLDTAPATLDALQAVVDAVDGRAEVYLDGGVRRGTDVVKALALGARAVAVGRPVVWGLAAAGTRGVGGVLEILREEIDVALALCGARRPEELDAGVLS